MIPKEQRCKISGSLGGQKIVSINTVTNEVKVYDTARDVANDGHNPSNVVSICKKHGRRFTSKGFTFQYFNDYVNQNGSLVLIN